MKEDALQENCLALPDILANLTLCGLWRAVVNNDIVNYTNLSLGPLDGTSFYLSSCFLTQTHTHMSAHVHTSLTCSHTHTHNITSPIQCGSEHPDLLGLIIGGQGKVLEVSKEKSVRPQRQTHILAGREGGREGGEGGEVGGHTVRFSDERKKEDICSLSKDKKKCLKNVAFCMWVCVCKRVCVWGLVHLCLPACLSTCLPVCLY